MASEYFSSVNDLVNDVSHDFFGEGYNPEIEFHVLLHLKMTVKILIQSHTSIDLFLA